jgi:hypothetical protein
MVVLNPVDAFLVVLITAHLMSTTMAGLFSTWAMLAVERTLTRMTRFHTIFVWGKSGIFFPPTHFYLRVTSKNKSCLFILQKMGSNFSRICQPVQVATTPNGRRIFLGRLADHKMVLKIDLLLRVHFVAILRSARITSFSGEAGSTTKLKQ